MKKLTSLLLAGAMVLGLAACGGQTTAQEPLAADTPREFDQASYDEESVALYDQAFGTFYNLYQTASDADTVAERWAIMAAAEAKMLESAVLQPGTTAGGSYAIYRSVPGTSSSVGWGLDADRFYTRLVTTEPIKAADYLEMRSKWYEVKGDGSYMDWVRQYLADKGYELQDEYDFTFTDLPDTYDDLASSKSVVHEALCNTYDSLLQYDNENVLQPALAESYEVSEDETVYTFHIRPGVKWVDSQGREFGEVTADDWVAGVQHMCDAAEGLEYLISTDGGCGIAGADEYLSGESTDFSTVGVKALDDLTLEITLVEPKNYFLSMMPYAVFAPLNRDYFESKGGKFGADYDATAADYTYAKTHNDILYCGAYLIESATAQNSVVFTANPSYWNADAVNVHTIKWNYNDSSDPTKTYDDFNNNVNANLGCTPDILEMVKQDGLFDEYVVVSNTDMNTYPNFFNINRYAFASFNDNTAGVSAQTAAGAERTRAAMQNVHFRRAVALGTDRGAMNAAVRGEDLKYNNLLNTFVPGDFVQLPEDATITVDGKEYTYPAGTYFGQIVQAQLEADGDVIKVWNDEMTSTAGFDGWYNPEAAKAELEQAIAELAEEGVEVSAENPIYLDLPYAGNTPVYTNRANAMKQSIEESLDKQVILNLVDCGDVSGWYNAGYYPSYGYEGNYDINDTSGWGPDYQDPETYLNTILPNYVGYFTKAMGVF